MDEPVVKPQPGPQWQAAESNADVLIYGGAAGGGKTYLLLMNAARYVGLSDYRGAIFRKQAKQISTGGGLWDEAKKMYRPMGAEFLKSPVREAVFPSGARIQFQHMKNPDDHLNFQGAQFGFIGFDELPHFPEKQFRYLLGRNRTTAAMDAHVVATCNPDGGSWVHKWVRPYLCDDDITPNYAMAGEIKHFIVENDKLKWVHEDYRTEDGIAPNTFTFIPAQLEDNPAMLDVDPRYPAKLKAQSRVEQKQLAEGLWVTDSGNAMFRHHSIREVEREHPFIQKILPRLRKARYWDLADTHVPKAEQDPEDANGPSWTAGACGGLWTPGPQSQWHKLDENEEPMPILIVEHVAYDQREGTDKDEWMVRHAKRDGYQTYQAWEQEPGSAGKYLARSIKDGIFGKWPTWSQRPTGDKVDRAKPLRRLAEKERVWFVKGGWERQVLWWLERFPNHQTDTTDALSGLLQVLTSDEFNSALRDIDVPERTMSRGTTTNPFEV